LKVKYSGLKVTHHFRWYASEKKNHKSDTKAQTVEQAEAWNEDYKIYCCQRPCVQAPREEVVMNGEDTTLV